MTGQCLCWSFRLVLSVSTQESCRHSTNNSGFFARLNWMEPKQVMLCIMKSWLPVDFTILERSYHHLKFQQNTNSFTSNTWILLIILFLLQSIHFNCFHVVKCNLLCQRRNNWNISTQISLWWTNKVSSSVGKSTSITGGTCHL